MRKQAERNNLPMGDRLRDKIDLLPGMDFYLDAFFALDTERDLSNGLSPIPWSSIRLYAKDAGCDDAEMEELVYFVRALDQAHMKQTAKKIKSAGKIKGGKL